MKSSEPPAEQWRGQYLRVVRLGHWEYADRVGASGAVAIVAVTEAGELVLTEQYRIPMDKRVIELPAGLTGDEVASEAEHGADAARRELLEETGFTAEDIVPMASGPPSAGLATEIVTFYLATGLQRVSAGGGVKHEQIEVHLVPVREVEQWLKGKEQEGALIDPKIFAGLYFVLTQLNLNNHG